MQELFLCNMLFKNVGDEVYVYDGDKLICCFDLDDLDFEKRCKDFARNMYL